MAITFVIGRAGSGKTRRCFKSIVDALKKSPLGPAIYWIAPRQATFSLERELTCAGGLGGFCRARVVSFEQLARDILADTGGGAIPEITPLGRQMILGHLLRQHEGELKFFKSVARQPGLAGKLDATFTEIERCGKDCADLATLHETMLADEREKANVALLDKVHDLHLIYDAYIKYLGQDRLDQHRRLLQVLSLIDNSRLLRDAEIYVDRFVEFTEYERRILARLGKVCRKVEIALLMDPQSALLGDAHQFPEELSLLHRCESTYRKLWFTFREEQTPLDETVVLTTIHRFQTPALASIERSLFGHRLEARGDAAGIELVECPSPRAEVDAAARKIRALCAAGMRLRDIAVVVRELEPYHELIDASFREHGIDYFVDRRRTVTHHPLLAFLRSALLLAQQPWPHEAVMTLLKTALAGLGPEETDELENYVLQHRIRGVAWAQEEPWQFKRDLTRGADTEVFMAEETATRRIDELRRNVVGKLRPFIAAFSAEALPIRQIVTEIFALFDHFGIRKTLGDWIQAARDAKEIEQANEHQQVWAELVNLFDQMVELLGGESVTLADFLAILESGLEQFTLALTPPAVDQLLVGQVDRTRTPNVKAVLVLGLGDGVFPHAIREDLILTDAERRELAERNLEVDPDTERRLLDEEMLGYIALTRASHQLYLSRPLGGAQGKLLGPSPYWRRLRALFPTAPIIQIPAEQRDNIEIIDTPRQLITALMRWARAADDKSAASPWVELYQWLARHPCQDDAIDKMRHRAWRALSYDNAAKLSPLFAGRLFSAPFRASVTRVETFTACPFKHFLQYGIALCPRDDQDVNALDLGNVFHHVLEQLVHRLVAQRQGWADLSAEERTKLIDEFTQEIAKSLRGEILMSSARNRYLLQRIEKTLQQVVAAQEAAGRRGDFRPAYAELTFGRGDDDLPGYQLITPSGKTVQLAGKIDRVDLTDEGACTIVDYKLRHASLSLDSVYHGLSLQLLTYLLVMQANGAKLAGKALTPAAAFYVRLLRTLEQVDHPSEAMNPDDPTFDLKTKPRGLLDEQFLSAIDRTLTTGASDVVQVQIKKDGGLGYRGNNDAAQPAEFSALLAHVRQRLGESLDRLLAGQIDIRPYRLNLKSPCAHCNFRSVCRFEPGVNSYRSLVSMKKETVYQGVLEGANHGE